MTTVALAGARPRLVSSGEAPRTSKQYSDWAASYDRDTAGYGWSAPQRLLGALGAFAAPRAGQRVLDVGVGTGLSTQPYLKAGAKVTGLDISTRMLEEIRKKKLPYARLAEYDIDLPLRSAGIQPGKFDVAISCGTLHFAKDLRATLGQMGAALASGGVLGFTFIPPQDRAFGPSTRPVASAEVRRMVEEMGFEVLKQEPFVAYHDKGNPDDPVKYELLVARKRAPPASFDAVG